MKQLKTTLLAFALLFTVNTLMAQEKYEYAIISMKHRELYIALDGKELLKVEVAKEDVKHSYFDPNPVLVQVNKMEDEGWEVMESEVYFAGSLPGYVFIMRRKEQ